MQKRIHESVMVREVVEALAVDEFVKHSKLVRHKNLVKHFKKALFIDATVGTGGHAVEIVKRGGFVIGIDVDREMLDLANERLAEACPSSDHSTYFKLIQGNFKDIDKLVGKTYEGGVCGILFDLGVSNLQLQSPTSGMSFSNPEAPLDMRVDQKNQAVTAAMLLNGLREDQLRELFLTTLRFVDARYLAGAVVGERRIKPFETVADFVSICEGIRKKPGLNIATLPFLAVRMAVNTELANLSEALPKAFGLLRSSGRLAVISFHSGEEKIIKDFLEGLNSAEVKVHEPTFPTAEEVGTNPKARSAKLRIIEKK